MEKHGKYGSAEYVAWNNMRIRCANAKRPGWKNYGGRGITICQEWERSFTAFYKHIGGRPSALHSLDRINNDGNYEPGNVRWATKRQQLLNRGDNRLLTYKGKTQTLTEWSVETGIAVSVLWARFHTSKWSVERILTDPIMSATAVGKLGAERRWRK